MERTRENLFSTGSFFAFIGEFDDEKDDVVWMNIENALVRQDVSELTKTLIRCAINGQKGFEQLPYEGNPKNGKVHLYGK